MSLLLAIELIIELQLPSFPDVIALTSVRSIGPEAFVPRTLLLLTYSLINASTNTVTKLFCWLLFVFL